jgi:hexosaminidase
MNKTFCLFIALLLVCVQGYQRDAAVENSVAGMLAGRRVWPEPAVFKRESLTDSSVLSIDPCDFKIEGSDALLKASGLFGGKIAFGINMYMDIMFGSKGFSPSFCNTRAPLRTVENATRLLKLVVELGDSKQRSETVETKSATEAYTIVLGKNGTGKLVVSSYVALLRGLETFSQLAVLNTDRAEFNLLSPVYIQDKPDFEHRGVLVDVARNFIPCDNLKLVIDGLMYSKMNVLHLHLTDSQSFPVQLTTGYGPSITEHGAYSANEVYSVKDLQDLIEYGNTKGVAVIPEIDSPGHSRALGLTPGLEGIISCANVSGTDYTSCCNEPPCGQLNPSSELMYKVLQDVVSDVSSIFSNTSLFHFGFDEVNNNCWTSDPSVAAYLKENNLTVPEMLAQFFSRERKMLESGVNAVYWDEVVSAGLHTTLGPDDIVQFWHKGDSGLLGQYLKETPYSNRAILSAYTSYYLDCGTGNEFGQNSWCDPYKTWRTIYFNNFLDGVNQTAIDIGRIMG